MLETSDWALLDAILPPRQAIKDKNICLFGSSANPPHEGHRHIVKYAAEKQVFDEIWIIAVYQHIYSSKRNLLPFEKRKRMLELSYESLKCNNCIIRILPIEQVAYSIINNSRVPIENHKSIGTIDIIQLLYEYYGIPAPVGNNNDTQFTLLMGTDTCMDLLNSKWKSSLLLLQHIKISLVSRFSNADISLCQFYSEFSHRISQLDIKSPEISSTYIRDYKPTSMMISVYACSRYLASLVPCELVRKGLLHPLVYEYITIQGIYFYDTDEVKQSVSSRRSTYLGIVAVTMQVIVGMYWYYK